MVRNEENSKNIGVRILARIKILFTFDYKKHGGTVLYYMLKETQKKVKYI